MSDAEYKKDLLGSCSMGAQDCKGNADYAAYAFSQGNETDAKKYVGYLENNLALLKSNMRTLERLIEKMSADGGGK